jgi:predicted enzyme related to lactoylglutathione lyase
MNNPVHWFEIYVQDLARARAFYEAVFPFKLTKIESPDIEMWGFPMDKNVLGAGGALVKMDGVQSGGNSVIIYFGCEDCANEAAKVERAGGKVQKPKTAIGPYGYIALVLDTEGNTIGLHSM